MTDLVSTLKQNKTYLLCNKTVANTALRLNVDIQDWYLELVLADSNANCLDVLEFGIGNQHPYQPAFLSRFPSSSIPSRIPTYLLVVSVLCASLTSDVPSFCLNYVIVLPSPLLPSDGELGCPLLLPRARPRRPPSPSTKESCYPLLPPPVRPHHPHLPPPVRCATRPLPSIPLMRTSLHRMRTR